jgi:hypothetical protein
LIFKPDQTESKLFQTDSNLPPKIPNKMWIERS